MIKDRLKALIAAPVSTALVTMARQATVCVLTYHRINSRPEIFPGMHVDAFREQMRWLRDRCTVLSADEFSQTLDAPRSCRPRVLVTFDDGYRDFHDVAYPVLQELRIPCLVFVATAFIGTSRLIWTDLVDAAAQLTKRSSARLPFDTDVAGRLEDPTSRARFAQRAKEHLKRLGDGERRAALGALLDELQVPQPQELLPRQMLTWDEVRATMPLATFGGHSHEHPILARLGAAEQESDLTTCTDIMRREIGSSPRYFAYPNGARGDFTPGTAALLKNLGYELAFATIPGLNGRASDRYALHRQYTSCTTIREFAWQVVGGAALLRRGNA